MGVGLIRKILLISFSGVPSYLARGFISFRRLDGSSSLCSFVYSFSFSVLIVGVFPLFFIIFGILSRISLLWGGMSVPSLVFFFYSLSSLFGFYL